jgi:glycosyltransferase involved in cell wall biosynthesis
MTTRRPRLAVITTHPIQYYAPFFRRLTDRGAVDVHVFYGWRGLTESARDPGFDRALQWDIPLLDGYSFSFVPNESKRPGSHHRNGIVSSALVPMVDRWMPDAVLVIGWNYRSHLSALRSFHGRVPVLFRGDSTLLGEPSGPRRWLRRMALRWVYRHVDVALNVGTENRRYFEAHGLAAAQIEWAPHAVDNERFHDPTGALDREAAAWRTNLGIPAGDTVAIFAGKLEAVKAPDLAVDAFVALGEPHAHLVVAGSGRMEGALRSRASACANVHFIGFQNQSRMPLVYRLGELLVVPSRSETWGLAVNEAMASGRAVIVSDRVGCAPDLVAAHGTGHVFPSGDAGALGDALRRLLTDAPARAEMGRRAAALVERWSLDAQADAVERTVARVVRSA